MYNYFSAKEETSSIFSAGSIDKNQFIKDGQIDMDHLLSRFAVHFNDIYVKLASIVLVVGFQFLLNKFVTFRELNKDNSTSMQ